VIGHTTSNQAKIQCAEQVDKHLGRVVQQAIQNDYVIAITADHGNLELMLTEEGKPHVAHTKNPVPFILIDPKSNTPLSLNDGSLQDIAPTILKILGIPQPEEMTGNNLSNHHDWETKRHVLLIILDGWGKGHEDHTNPIHLAKTPVWDELTIKYPPSLLQASGDAVGLQEGKAGNSEAGHMNIGAGRAVLQDDVRLDQAMKDGTFSTNTIFLQAIEGVRERHSRLHLIGLLTEKSSHGSIDYPLAVLKIARDMGIQDIYLHLIFDGRSTEPGSAPVLLEKLDDQLAEIGAGEVVTGMGRGIALDRDGNYEKIQRAYEALVMGKGRRYS
jgi:2,3-bisphosphoglycerate-independent phosphoglycerate mutase